MSHPINPQDNLELPAPDPEAIAHSERLIEVIAAAIESGGGSIDFAEYMQRLLYEPGLGYYAAGAEKFGADGDFVTAPEISPLFGACLATQIRDLYRQGAGRRIFEFGAGSGRLCADLLRSATDTEAYLILEPSAALQRRQQDYLRQVLNDEQWRRVEWMQSLPEKFDGVVIANEVLDAMPVHRVRKRDRWIELGVGLGERGFEWRLLEADTAVIETLAGIEAQLGDLPADYETELNLNYAPWLRALSDACERAAVLLIDYGYECAQYYHPARASGTLICHYRHRAHADPFVYPGLQDVTAFVDFDACADAAEASGFSPLGLVSQAEFLLANGLLEHAAASDDIADQLALAQQVKTLTLPQEMGEKFKVLALQKNLSLEMPAMLRGGMFG